MAESTAARVGDGGEPRFELRVSDDAMEVLLTCDVESLERGDIYQRVLAELQRLEVKVVRDRMELLLRAETTLADGLGVGFEDEPVAAGTRPTPPQDGRTEWSKDYFNTQYVVDPQTGAIDFTRRLGDPSVEDGEVIAILHPPVPGTPGSDVFGNPIPVPNPKTDHAMAGEYVVFDPAVNGLKATRAGRISRADGKIHVDNVYEILTDLGGETGSVSHKGTVIVHGDIEDNYVLEATEDVEVKGTIRECKITCGGNLTAVGGITSNFKGSIHVEGACQTRYAIQTHLECKGPITVEKEIYQTTTRTLSSISCPKGRIVGGKAVATQGIDVGEAGSKVGTPTHFVIEADPSTRAKIFECRSRIDASQKALNDLYDKFRHLKPQVESFGAAGAVALAKTQEDIDRVEAEMLEATNEIQALLSAQKEDKNARIIVRACAHPGVVFRIFSFELAVDGEIEGPFVAHLDWQKMEIAIRSGK